MKTENFMWIIISVLLLAGIIWMSADMISPYKSIAEAVKSGRHVQLIGTAAEGPPVIVPEISSFYLKDSSGTPVLVVYSKSLPQNFLHSEKIVVTGKYDMSRNHFIADNVLLKCPSKYAEKARQTEMKK